VMTTKNTPDCATAPLITPLWGRWPSDWAFLEAMIDETIAELAKADEQAVACITSQLRMDALIALARLRGLSEPIIKELKSFQGRLQALGEERNRVVHDPLVERRSEALEKGKVSKFTSTARGVLKFGFFSVSLA
jgi:hypothetical protein